MVKIRLKRLGSKKRPFYRIVVQDSREPRDGKVIEELGYYQPVSPSDVQISLSQEGIKKWIACGAQPTDTVKCLMNKMKVTL